MALPNILDMDAEIIPFFGAAVSSAEAQLLSLMQSWAESQARQFVGHVITRATITNEYQRRDDIGGYYGGGALVDIGGAIVHAGGFGGYGSEDGHILQLDNGFVRSVSDCREDGASLFGQGASDFAAGTQLTLGTQFHLELDSSGLCKSGRLIRSTGNWSTTPGTIRITYIAGLSPSELDNEYSFVKLAILEDMQVKFNQTMSQRGSNGPIKKETWSGDYSAEYAVDVASRSLSMLSPGAQAKLQPIKRINI